MRFVKMEGIGNDFIVTHEVAADRIASVVPHVIKMCDRRRGIGGDGLILILPSDTADFTMRIFNSDGSEPEMCGNGIRCCARYIALKKLSNKKKLQIETLAGMITTELLADGSVKVNMGAPRLEADTIPVALPQGINMMVPLSVDGREFLFTPVSMGNPHAVIYADTLDDDLVLGKGPKIETHPLFPRKTNVEFVKVHSFAEVTMRVWERGCGETQACGTGACAVVVSGILNQLHGKDVTVHLPGGDLQISWSGTTADPVMMTGSAVAVFDGEIAIE